jgi:hypothetical protein
LQRQSGRSSAAEIRNKKRRLLMESAATAVPATATAALSVPRQAGAGTVAQDAAAADGFDDMDPLHELALAAAAEEEQAGLTLAEGCPALAAAPAPPTPVSIAGATLTAAAGETELVWLVADTRHGVVRNVTTTTRCVILDSWVIPNLQLGRALKPFEQQHIEWRGRFGATMSGEAALL